MEIAWQAGAGDGGDDSYWQVLAGIYFFTSASLPVRNLSLRSSVRSKLYH